MFGRRRKRQRSGNSGTIRASGPFIRCNFRKAGFQGLQAHEKKIQFQRTPCWFQSFGFCLSRFSFLLSFGLDWFGSASVLCRIRRGLCFLSGVTARTIHVTALVQNRTHRVFSLWGLHPHTPALSGFARHKTV